MLVQNEADTKLRVYYDGLCRLCSREIDMYRGMKGSDRISFIDITSSSFNAELEGLDPMQVHKSFHAKDEQGNVYEGVESFILIWERLDKLKPLAPVARKRPVFALLKAGYCVFAKIRPLLPKKNCNDSPYCEANRIRSEP